MRALKSVLSLSKRVRKSILSVSYSARAALRDCSARGMTLSEYIVVVLRALMVFVQVSFTSERTAFFTARYSASAARRVPLASLTLARFLLHSQGTLKAILDDHMSAIVSVCMYITSNSGSGK